MYMYICTQCVWWCVLRQLTAVHGPQITGTTGAHVTAQHKVGWGT